MIVKFNKGTIGHITKNFTYAEVMCTCSKCHEQLIDDRLIRKLQVIRDYFNTSLQLSSVYRCQKHQDELSAQGYQTAKGISTHTLGQAADIIYPLGIKKEDFIEQLKSEFLSIGIAKTFVHVDLRKDKKRIWYYV